MIYNIKLLNDKLNNYYNSQHLWVKKNQNTTTKSIKSYRFKDYLSSFNGYNYYNKWRRFCQLVILYNIKERYEFCFRKITL